VFNAPATREAGRPNSPSKFNENIPAFTVGGPVYIPHLYNGTNKTFFFAGGQWESVLLNGKQDLTGSSNSRATGSAYCRALASTCPNVALYLKLSAALRATE